MNIYIYGNDKFKKDIHTTLNNANIQFKLDSNTLIKNIDTLEELENTIKENPKNIYLIDDEKIIKKNSKIKFLNPKDGIDENFLLDHGIADLSVDSLNEIPKYILRKYEEQQNNSSEIHSSIVDIVDEAYEEDEQEENIQNENEDEDKEKFELDEELSLLLSNDKEDIQEDVSIDSEEKEEFLEDVGLNNVSSDYDEQKVNEENEVEESVDTSMFENENFDNLDFVSDDENDDLDGLIAHLNDDESLHNLDIINSEELNLEQNNIEEDETSVQGESMSDKFSELDSLAEKDILSALNLEDTTIQESVESTEVLAPSENNEAMNLSSSNASELSELITKLIKNKTLEITIKIKD